MLRVYIQRIAVSVALLLCCVPATFAQSVAGLRGGSYLVGSSGDLITSLSNDDGSVVTYEYDSAGLETGMTVSLGSDVSLSLQYSLADDGSGWLQAGSLPPLMSTSDTDGRTAIVALYPSFSRVNGEWQINVNGPDPIDVAIFSYEFSGHLSAVSLDNGLSLQLGTPTATGVVSEALIRPNGALAATAAPLGGTNGVNAVPAHLDAIATRFGLGANWAETMTFSIAPSGHLTTGRDGSGVVQLYLVDVGPFRVGYAPDGTALFYDFVPTYRVGDIANGSASQVAGVAPSHIVMTATGAAGLYTDQPAFGAIYSAWTETNASGVTETRFATVDASPSSNLHMTTSSVRSRRLRVRSDGYIRYRTTVCAAGECWDRYWFEWVDEVVFSSGGGGSTGGGSSLPPASGGRIPVKPGNNLVGDPKIWAQVNRGLNKAKTKLQNETCKALLNRTGTTGQTLSSVMKARGYDDPTKYLTGYVGYVTGASADCVDNPMASTQVGAQRVAICPPMKNATDGMTSVYLIHEMLHTLGYGESPQVPGFPTSPQITQEVTNACGSN